MKKLLFVAVLFIGSAQAAPVTWTFHDVEYMDGSVTQGSFTFDANTGVYASIDNVFTLCGTSVNCVRVEYEFVDGDSVSMVAANDFLDPFPLLANFLWAEPLTNAGGTVSLRSGTLHDGCGTQCIQRTLMLQGATLTAVPIARSSLAVRFWLGVAGVV